MLLLQDITVTYQSVVPAVQKVSIEVPEKSVVALLGTNGAGKTTIFRAITGLLNFHKASIVAGAIHFEGERIDRLNATQIVQRGIAQVLEGRRLFADLTVDENLRTGAISAGNSAATRRAKPRALRACASEPPTATGRARKNGCSSNGPTGRPNRPVTGSLRCPPTSPSKAWSPPSKRAG